MKCPNCEKKMKHKKGTGMHFDTSGTAEDYEPTEKQINTILFINNRLNMDLPMLTKHQCQADIGKYFVKAKCVPEHAPYSEAFPSDGIMQPEDKRASAGMQTPAQDRQRGHRQGLKSPAKKCQGVI